MESTRLEKSNRRGLSSDKETGEVQHLEMIRRRTQPDIQGMLPRPILPVRSLGNGLLLTSNLTGKAIKTLEEIALGDV
jgi:hypothetical protein